MSEARRELERVVRRYLAFCFRNETPPRVSELADIVGMSVPQFSRTFKDICGENPSVTLKRIQLRKARRQLARGQTVNRAAYQAGFGTRRSIFRAFRRALGTTPGGSRSNRQRDVKEPRRPGSMRRRKL